MTDIVDRETRSRMMSSIRGRDTKPEITVRKALFAAGFRFRLQRRDLPGVPDIVLPVRRVAIFVHGCFWHVHQGCRYARMPSTRQDFWREKLGRNTERDRESQRRLLELGWRVLVVWECATRGKGAVDNLPGQLARWIALGERSGELPASASAP